MKHNLSLFAFFILTLFSHAQPVSIFPAQPRWNDKVEWTYNPSDTLAVLQGNETVFIDVSITYQDLSSRTIKLTCLRKNGLHKAEMLVPEGACYLESGFYTQTRQDDQAGETILVFGPDGLPVRGAHYGMFVAWEPEQEELADSVFQLELRRFPDHLEVYGVLFQSALGAHSSDEFEKTLATYMSALEKMHQQKKWKDDPGLLFSICMGYAKSKQVERSSTYFLELLAKHPESPLLVSAWQPLCYAQMMQEDPMDFQQVMDTIKALAKRNQSDLLVEETIFLVANDTAVPLNTVERHAFKLIVEEPESTDPLIQLGKVYLDRGEKLVEAEELARKALKLLAAAPVDRRMMDYNEYERAEIFFMLSRIKRGQHEADAALEAIDAAIGTISGNSREDQLLLSYRSMRAGLYLQLGNLSFAMQEYALLYLSDYPGALDSLRSIHRRISPDSSGFQQFVAEQEKAVADRIKSVPAPVFTFSDMGGVTYSLQELKGKVVVINFWAIGCAPCIKEMPDLNTLVKEYSANTDVVFLAPTGDSKGTLSEFLKKHPFEYKVIPEAQSAYKSYRIQAWPTHVIIDRQGQIVRKFSGAGPTTTKIISRSIDRALAN